MFCYFHSLGLLHLYLLLPLLHLLIRLVSKTCVAKGKRSTDPKTKCLMACTEKYTEHFPHQFIPSARENERKKKITESSRFMDPLSSPEHGMNLKTVAISFDLSLFLQKHFLCYSICSRQHRTKYPIWIFDGYWKCASNKKICNVSMDWKRFGKRKNNYLWYTLSWICANDEQKSYEVCANEENWRYGKKNGAHRKSIISTLIDFI